ncbi:ATP-binding protein [Sphaerisporangium sp. NPDC088356]|uniref:ATP-binding protein n=1 Tax=Sphaerisporangium sp. NPDC088356 TaxID=3154871 RepID=UPI00341E9186
MTVTREVHWDLPADPAVVAKARHLVRETLTSWGMRALAEDVTVVVSELLTNAVMHAQPPITLSLKRAGRALRGEVADQGGIWLDHGGQLCPADGEHGRGLHIVNALADRWGVHPGKDETGKVVWFSRLMGS